MHTLDEVVMHADPDAIYRAAAEIERWPEILPHYRWVRVLGEDADARIVEMAARRGWLPVWWRSRQSFAPDRRRVYYSHTGGLTRGMEVEWRIEPEGGGVRVSISHDFHLRAPIVRSFFGRWIVARYFVHPIAGRTLSVLKQFLEASMGPEDQGKEIRVCDAP